jgi:hypothetical protein
VSAPPLLITSTRETMIRHIRLAPALAALVLSAHPVEGQVPGLERLRRKPEITHGVLDQRIYCPESSKTSVPIPFEHVDLGPAGQQQGGDDLLLGQRMLAVISDSTRWSAVWNAAVEPPDVPEGRTPVLIPPPAVSFGGGVLVLVATRTWGMGRVRLHVTSIRQCRGSGMIIVTTTQTGPRGTVGIAVRSRGIDVVRVEGRALSSHAVLLEERFKLEPY